MGQGDSKEEAKMKAMVNKLDKMELKDIEAVFMELASTNDQGDSVIKKPNWLNRDKLAEALGTNDFLIEQLFSAFDKDGNGSLDLQEFITGMAICLHGSIKKKCELLFKIFNLDGDDGIDPKELTLVLTSCMQSAHSLLRKASLSEGMIKEDDEDFNDPAADALVTAALVDKIVKDAFEKCDISHTGKLEINEFANWVHKNPKLVNNIFVMQCPKPTRGPGHSNPSFIIDDEDEEIVDIQSEEGIQSVDICIDIDDLSNSNTNNSEQVSNNSSDLKPTLKELFSDASEPDGSNFFDSIGNNQEDNFPVTGNQSLDDVEHLGNNGSGESGHRRTQSAIFAERHTYIIDDSHTGSQGDLNQITSENHLKSQTASESLYSIALSQDSLNEEKDGRIEVPDVLVSDPINPEPTNEILNEGTVTEEDQPQIFHPVSPPETLFDGSEMEAPIVTDNISSDEVGVECLELTMDFETKCNLVPSFPTETIAETIGACFWQPSVQTLQSLQFVAEGNAIPDNKLIHPQTIVDSLMNDPVKDLVEKYLGEQEASKRPIPNVNHIELNEEELCKLLQMGCWRAGLDFTKRYLDAHQTKVTSVGSKEEPLLNPKIIQVWFVRIALLIRLRMFSSAESELNAFKDFESPDLYYQFYPHLYPGKEGCMIPFSFRLLHAELPQHNGKSNLTLNRLYDLLTKVEAVHRNLLNGLTEAGEQNDESIIEKDVQDRVKLWEKRILKIHYSLANCFLGMREYLLTVQFLEQIIILDPSREIAILSTIGRIYLQLGDCKTAQKYFQRIGDVGPEDTNSLSMITMNSAFMSLTKGLYKDAYQQFLSALNLDSTNLSACNNAAVCLLFMGKVKEASDLLETMVCQSPEKSLHEEILLNLTTVYELETSRALQKKHKLLDLVCKHKGDGFNVQCLKLT